MLVGGTVALLSLLAKVSDGMFFMRTFIGLIVGGFIGFCFDYFMTSAPPLPLPTPKGRAIDIVLPETSPEPTETGEFVPFDMQKSSRVVKEMVQDR